MPVSKKYIFILLCLALFLSASCVLAQANRETLPNPLGTENFADLITRVIEWVRDIGILIAGGMIIWLGLKLVFYAGNEAERAQTLKGLWWAIAGIAILLIGGGFISIIRDILGLPPEGSMTATGALESLRNAVRWFFGIAFAIAFMVIVWGLVDWARCGDDAEKIKKAQAKLVYGLIGITLIICLNTVIALIANFVGVTAPTI